MRRMMLLPALLCFSTNVSAQEFTQIESGPQNSSGDSRIFFLDFNELSAGASVNEFFAGGTDSLGETGPDFRVSFMTGEWITAPIGGPASAFAAGSPNYAQGQDNLAFLSSGQGYINFLVGLETGLNFYYGSGSFSTVEFFTGANGTGSRIASYSLGPTDPFTFENAILPFSGIAFSMVVTNDQGDFVWDNVTFGSLISPVPEPENWALMILGFGTAGAALRGRMKLSKSRRWNWASNLAKW